MRNLVISLFALASLAGCAGTQKAAIEPSVTPAASVASAEPDMANSRPAVSVLSSEPVMQAAKDVAPISNSASNATSSQQGQDPFQWMMAWTKGMHQALLPWAQTVQACDTRAARN